MSNSNQSASANSFDSLRNLAQSNQVDIEKFNALTSSEGIVANDTVEVRITRTSIEREDALRGNRKADSKVFFTLSHGRVTRMDEDHYFGNFRSSRRNSDNTATEVWCRKVTMESTVPAELASEMSPALMAFLGAQASAKPVQEVKYGDFDLAKFLTLSLGHDHAQFTFNINKSQNALIEDLQTRQEGCSLVLRFRLSEMNVEKGITVSHKVNDESNDEYELPIRVTPTFIGFVPMVTNTSKPGVNLEPDVLDWAMAKASTGERSKAKYLNPAVAERRMLDIASVGTGKKAHHALRDALKAAVPYSREWELAKNRLEMVAFRGKNPKVTEQSIAQWVQESLDMQDEEDAVETVTPVTKPAAPVTVVKSVEAVVEAAAEMDEPAASKPVSDEELDAMFD